MVINELPASKGKTCVTKGINVTARYIEEVDGTVVNGHQVSDMRSLTSQVFQQLLKHNAAPAKFKSITREGFQFYLYHMYSNFRFLRFCEGHWKVIRLGSTTYSGWFRNHVSDPEERAIKAEVTRREVSVAPKKRPAPTISTQAPKKTKLAMAALPTPIRSPTPEESMYLDEPDLPESVEPVAHAELQQPTSKHELAKIPVDLPTPISLPTPTIATAELSDHKTTTFMAEHRVEENATARTPAIPSDADASPLDILADVSGMITKTNLVADAMNATAGTSPNTLIISICTCLFTL